MKERDCSEDLDVDFREIMIDGVGWMHLTQGRDQWQALVNTVMNLRLP
jgi:hypothetical protein